MQITYIHCAPKTGFVWEKTKKQKNNMANEKKKQTKKPHNQVFSRKHRQYLQGCIYTCNFRCLFWSTHGDDLSIHQVVLTENPRSAPPPRRQLWNRGFLFSKPHQHCSLTAYAKVSWGREKSKAKKKKKKLKERERSQECAWQSLPLSLWFLFFWAALPG